MPLAAAFSLAVAVVAVFFAAFQSIFFISQRKLTSNVWAALFSLSCAGFSFFVMLQIIGPPTLFQQEIDRAQFSFLILMAHSLCGYTFSFLQIRGRWYHRIGTPLFLVIAAILWSTNLITSRTLIFRSFAWLPAPYVETVLGPLGAPFMALIVATALFALFFWVRRNAQDRSVRVIFSAGLSLFILLGIHDALVSNEVITSVMLLLQFGFTGFAASILYITVKEYVHFQSTADSLGRLNEELSRMAVTDGLTKLANRRGFDVRFEQEYKTLARHRRLKTLPGALSLVLCDVDFFKEYNDTYGHQAGDRCLVAVAGALARCTRRPGDLVSRLGGDEFAILLPDTPLSGAQTVAAAVLNDLREQKIEHEGSRSHPRVTLSMGVASARVEEALTPEKLFARADRGLYRAKSLGRDRAEAVDHEGQPAG